MFAILAGCGTLREATGNVTEIDDWSFANCTGKDCKWGLYNDFQVKLFLHMPAFSCNIHISKAYIYSRIRKFKKIRRKNLKLFVLQSRLHVLNKCALSSSTQTYYYYHCNRYVVMPLHERVSERLTSLTIRSQCSFCFHYALTRKFQFAESFRFSIIASYISVYDYCKMSCLYIPVLQ